MDQIATTSFPPFIVESECLDVNALLLIQDALRNDSRAQDLKLCHSVRDRSGRFDTRRYQCIDAQECQLREINNASMDAMQLVLGTIKYVAVLCLPWVLPYLITVSRKRRFAVIGPHLWRKLDGKEVNHLAK